MLDSLVNMGKLIYFLWAFLLVRNVCAELVNTPLLFDYEDIKTVSVDIIENFSPTNYQYVFLGGSPTPILAFFENLGLEVEVASLSFPSALSHHFDADDEFYAPFLKSFTNVIKKKLNLNPDKKYLFIDYAHSGTTLKGLMMLINDAHIYPEKVEYLGIHSEQFPEQLTDSDVHLMQNNRLGMSFFFEKYKPYRPYPSVKIGNEDYKNKKIRPLYIKFKNLLYNLMERDISLENELRVKNLSLKKMNCLGFLRKLF